METNSSAEPAMPVRLAGVSNKTTMSQVVGGLTIEFAVLHPAFYDGVPASLQCQLTDGPGA
jgi:hypothetical protein